MSITELFSSLGAPLIAMRWSWGAVHAKNGAVFLRVWQDECQKIDGRNVVRITDNLLLASASDRPGYSERLRHIDLIRQGSASFMIMCLAEDIKADPRKIRSFNGKEIFVGGVIIDHNGESWLEYVRKVPITEF